MSGWPSPGRFTTVGKKKGLLRSLSVASQLRPANFDGNGQRFIRAWAFLDERVLAEMDFVDFEAGGRLDWVIVPFRIVM